MPHNGMQEEEEDREKHRGVEPGVSERETDTWILL